MSAIDYWEDYEVVRIETPEALELRLPLAGFGPRLLALVVDSIIQTVAMVLLFLIFMLLLFGQMQANPDSPELFTIMMIGLIVISLLITAGYYIIFEWMWNGQTPGKRIVGIRVVKRGGLPLLPSDVLMRNIVRLVDLLPSSYFIGVIAFFVSKNQQRIGDLAADTIVIREFGNQLPYHWVGSLTQGTRTLTPAGISLDGRDAYIVSNLLARRFQLSPEARFRISGNVIRRLGYDPAALSLDQREGYLASLMGQHGGRI